MTGSHPTTIFCAAMPFADDDGIPEWIHLVPAGIVNTADGRGPWRVEDVSALMAASLKPGGKLVLDENHSTDLAAPKGASAPARGWIVELQSRADGIWGRVEWTPKGRELMADKAYRGVSPAIRVREKSGVITRIERASLTNLPNLVGLVSLHHQEDSDMGLKEGLIEALSLDGGADDDTIVKAVKEAIGAGAVQLQSALAPIAKAAGLADNADAAAVLAGVQQLASKQGGTVTQLQNELANVTLQLNSLQETSKRRDAEAYVDGEIRAGRVGLKPVRDEYVSIHMQDPAQAKKLIEAMPILNGGPTINPRDPAPQGDNEKPELLARRASLYQRKLADAGETIDFATAVLAVKEGKDK